MRKILLLLLSTLFSVSLLAQISHGGEPRSFQLNQLKSSIDYKVMPEQDIAQLLAEDAEDEMHGDIPWRFGKELEVDYDLNNSGTWDVLENGDRIWRLEITSYGAYSINLIYDEFYMPAGGEFFVYNEQKSHIIGSFNSSNNKPEGSFATVPVRGETCILEYYEPASEKGKGKIAVSYVIHAYKNILDIASKGFGSSGACNVNVNCPEGDNWRDEQRGVAMILTSTNNRICSGSMINNTAEDGTPYFLTANHCGSGVSENWIIMFNYESPECENIDGPTNQSVQYTTVRATSYISDLLLLELSEEPPIEYNVFYNGWNRSDDSTISTVAIHHPKGDIKKISFDYDTVTADKYLGTQGVDGSHWKIEKWDLGTTEGGSSGSPLFNQDKQIIGQLHGGWASCTALEPDWYGKVSYSWDYYDDPEKQLKHWLDPLDLGVMSIDGYDAGAVQFDHNAAVIFITKPDDIYNESATFSPEVVIRNKGMQNLTSLNVSYQINNDHMVSLEWTGDLESSESETIVFPEINVGFGEYEFKAYTDSPNGEEDGYPRNDTLSKAFEVLVAYDLAIKEFHNPSGINCNNNTMKVDFIVENKGAQIIYGFDYIISLDGNIMAEESNNQFLDPGEDKYVTYPLDINDDLWHELKLEVLIPDHEDQLPENNIYTTEFSAYGNNLDFVLGTDVNAAETSWILKDGEGNEVDSGSDYTNNQKYKFPFCLMADCYEFTLFDSGGDGIDLSLGMFELQNTSLGITYLSSVNFEDQVSVNFCISSSLYGDFNIPYLENCTNTEVTFNNLSVNAESYLWKFEGGTPAESSSESPVVTYAETGVFDVELTVTNGEESQTIKKENYITIEDCSGLEEVSSQIFSIYPNPSSGFISIIVEENHNFDQLIIYDALGKVQFTDKLQSSSVYQQELSLPSGLYMVELRSPKQATRKMFLMK